MSQDLERRPGKSPLHRCNACGERLYMTLDGVKCFNCVPEEYEEYDKVAAAPVVDNVIDLRSKKEK